MATDILNRWIGAFASERLRGADENKLAALLDACLERMADGREPAFALRHAPEASAEMAPLLEIATLLRLRGRLMRDYAS